MSEAAVVAAIRLAVSKIGARVFRNHRGKHQVIDKAGGKPRWIETGLCAGASDLIGWTPVKITPEHVGRTLAVFTAIEAKSARGEASKDQGNFLLAVLDAGGIAVVAKSEDDAIAAIDRVALPIRRGG